MTMMIKRFIKKHLLAWLFIEAYTYVILVRYVL